jgi:hypothetical protein
VFLAGGSIQGISVPLSGVPVVVGWSCQPRAVAAPFGMLGALWRRGGPLAELAGAAVVV